MNPKILGNKYLSPSTEVDVKAMKIALTKHSSAMAKEGAASRFAE